MDMFNVTEVRQNANKIISQVLKTKEPVMVLQRSKPVAYIIEARAFEQLLEKVKKFEQYEKIETARKALSNLAKLRSEMDVQPDSTPLIRQIREGIRWDE